MNDWRLTIICLLLADAEPVAITYADPQTWAAFTSVATDLELLAPDYLPTGVGLASEVNWCREHLPTLTAPSIGHASRLPSCEFCRAQWALATDHLSWIETQQLVYPHRDYFDLKCRAASRQRSWDLMADAANPQNTWACRRQALRDILEAVGPKRFYAGEWSLD